MEYEQLKKTLCNELKSYRDRTTFTASDIERIRDLSSAIKNIGKIEKMDDYSGYREPYRRSYGIVDKLDEMAENEPDAYKRSEIKAFARKMREI